MSILTVKARESKLAEILEKRKRKEITQEAAATLMRLSKRQMRRLEKRFAEKGLAGIIHGNRGKPSSRKMATETKASIMRLLHTKYERVGPTLTAELLFEDEKIEVSPQTIRRFMKEAGLLVKQRKHGKHRYWRKPKDHEGEMVQLDGSDHDWFEERGPRCTLIAFVDDATKTLWARFYQTESFYSVASATRDYIKEYGRPVSFYADCGKVFKVNQNNPDNEFITQYKRALNSIDIELKHAYSPQAKGRIERCFGTIQRQLEALFRIRDISNINEANQFLINYYIPRYNRKYTRVAAESEKMYRNAANINLADVFTVNKLRKVRNDWTVQCNKKIFQLLKDQPAIVRPKDIITICIKLDGTLYMELRGLKLNYTQVEKLTKQEPKIVKNYQHKPSKDNPWRKTNSLLYKKK